MPQSTEELKSAVSGLTGALIEMGNVTEQLSAHATQFTEEAAGHGWHGMASRMEEAADALTSAAAQIGTAMQACGTASEELGLINDRIPANEVVTHLATSSTQLNEAVTALDGAVERVEEAQEAVDEIGQEGMIQATSDLHDKLTEVNAEVAEHKATTERERAAADAYAKRQPGK